MLYKQRKTHQGHTQFDVATATTGYNIGDGIGRYKGDNKGIVKPLDTCIKENQ